MWDKLAASNTIEDFGRHELQLTGHKSAPGGGAQGLEGLFQDALRSVPEVPDAAPSQDKDEAASKSDSLSCLLSTSVVTHTVSGASVDCSNAYAQLDIFAMIARIREGNHDA